MATVKHINRSRARKSKKGCGCQMCKPYKHKWEPRFKAKEKQERERILFPSEDC